MIGAFRTWRTQNAMVRGKAITGGIEIILLAAGFFAVSVLLVVLSCSPITNSSYVPQILLLFFILMIAVDIEKEDTASK